MNSIRKLQIGNVTLENNLILAPMAGVTDLPFRVLCKEQGAGLICMEMVSAKGIYYNNKNTESLLAIDEREHPVSLQLFGSDPEIMSEMAKRIEHRPFDILDINMGCPVPKVVNNGEGSALMKNPELVGQIIGAMSKKCKKPVTLKIRTGFNDSCINAPEIARIAEANGAAAVAVHGRTREQYYSGQADWSVIRQVKKAVQIPVIGNGDITDAISAKSMLEETGCDAIMIGRAARGNPWIFREISEYLNTGVIPDGPSPQEITDMILRHTRMLIEFKGEYTGIREMRTHICFYVSGLRHANDIRRKINTIESYAELEELFASHPLQ